MKIVLKTKNHIMLLHLNKFDEILTKYDHFVFVSPHLDDAILSCGNLIHKLSKKNKKIFIVTVFTKASEVASTQAKDFLNLCHYKDANKFFRDREIEDIKACQYLKINAIHMAFVDAAWRHYNGKSIYSSNKTQYSGKISYKDRDLIKKLTDKLFKMIKKNDKTLLLSPLGIGNHIDHLIVKKTVNKLKIDKIYWEDYPYNRNKKNVSIFRKENNKYKPIRIQADLSNKIKKEAILKYKSQTRLLFSNGKFALKKEKYYEYNS